MGAFRYCECDQPFDKPSIREDLIDGQVCPSCGRVSSDHYSVAEWLVDLYELLEEKTNLFKEEVRTPPEPLGTKDVEETYTVKIVRPAGVSKSYMRDYIREALEDWSGQLDPESLEFNIGKVGKVRVTRQVK